MTDKVFHILDNVTRTGIQNEITMELIKYEKQFPLFNIVVKLNRQTWINICTRAIRNIAMIDRINKGSESNG